MSPTSTLPNRPIRRVVTLGTVVLMGAVFGACDSGKTPPAPVETHRETQAQTDARAQRARTLKTLADEDMADEARLASIHSARDLKITEATPELRKLLAHPNPDLVVAAAAALDGLNAKDTDLALMEAAGHLGRAREFEHLRQLLYILGSVGGPRARTYLETVAEGHELSAIRNTAQQILNDM